MKRYLSGLLALVLVLVIGLTGCSNKTGVLSGDYRQDTNTILNTMRQAIAVPQDAPNRAAIESEARKEINDFAARYQRDSSVSGLPSFTTMRTALNSLAGHYSSYPNRPVPQKLRDRLEQEFKRVEASLRRGA